MGSIRTIMILCIVVISLFSYSVCSKKKSKSKRKSSVKHHGNLARLVSKMDHKLGSKNNISYIVNPLKYSNYVEQFKKIKNLGEEVRCKLRGTCAEDLKRFQITHGGARHFRIRNKVGQKKSMQSFSAVNMPDTSNQVIQSDRLLSTEGPNPSQFMTAAYSNQPNAAEFGQQPQMNIQLPKSPEGVPMGPQQIPTMDQMQNAANDASIQNSIQSKMSFMDSANDQMMPFAAGPQGGMGPEGRPDSMGLEGMRAPGGPHPSAFARHHGPIKAHEMDDMPSRESSRMNEEEEQPMHDGHHHHDHPSSEPSRFSDDNKEEEEASDDDQPNDHPSNISPQQLHESNMKDSERDSKEMHEMHEMPNNREFSSMNDEAKEEERMRMSDGPRGVPNTDTASVSDEDIYKAEGVQPNEMKDLHNFLARNHNKYKPKDEEEESIRENEEFNENERRHGEQLSRDREDKDYRGDSRSPDKDERNEGEEEHGEHHSQEGRNEPEEEYENKHHSSHHHHGGHGHEHGVGGEPVGHAIGGPMGLEPGMGPPPGMGMGMGGPGGPMAGLGPVAGMGMGPEAGMGGPPGPGAPGMGPGAGMGPGMEGMGPGVGMVKPGGVEVPTLNNLMGGGVPLTGMADDTLGGPPGRPNVDFDNQGRFVSDNQRNMMESNSDYDVPKTGRKNFLHEKHEEGEDEKENRNEKNEDDKDDDDNTDKINARLDKEYDKELEEKMISDAEKEAEDEEAKDKKKKKEEGDDNDESENDEKEQENAYAREEDEKDETPDEDEGNKLEATESEEEDDKKDGKEHERTERCILHGDDGTDLDDRDVESRCNIHKYKHMHDKGTGTPVAPVAHQDKEIHNLGDGIHTGDVILSDASTEKILVPVSRIQLPLPMHDGKLSTNPTAQARKRTNTPAFASLWKDYMLTTQSQLADKDPSANNRGHIHHPHHGGKKSKVRKHGKELHRWKKSYVEEEDDEPESEDIPNNKEKEDDERGTKRSDAPPAPIPNETAKQNSNISLDNTTQNTAAQITNTTTTPSNDTKALASVPSIDQSNSTAITNTSTIDSPQNKTVESTKNDTKPAKKSDVKAKPDTLPPIYLTIKNGEKLLVVHPTAEFINSLPKINFTEDDENAAKRTTINSKISTYISPLNSRNSDEDAADDENDDEDGNEDDEEEDKRSNIETRSNIFTKAAKNKGFISVPVINPDPNGKIGQMLNTARDKVFNEGERETPPMQRPFGDAGRNFGTPLTGQVGERREPSRESSEYSQQIQNVPNQFEQAAASVHKGFYKNQPEGSIPIPKDIQSLYQQYQPGDGKNNFQYAPSQDEVREELNYVEHKNENNNEREDGGMSQFMSNQQQDPQMAAENDYNNRIAEPDNAPVNPNRDPQAQWDQGDQRMADKRSDQPIVYTKEHVGFGPITVEAKTADAPPDDPALDE